MFLSSVTEGQPATCASPAYLAGSEIVSLMEDQFVCGEFPAHTQPLLVTDKSL